MHRNQNGSVNRETYITMEDHMAHLKELKETSEALYDLIERMELSEQYGLVDLQQHKSMCSLIIEYMACNREYEEAWKEYDSFRSALSGEESERVHVSRKLLPYLTQFGMLAKAISLEPLNSAAYNALFTLFEREYAAVSTAQRKLMIGDMDSYLEAARNPALYFENEKSRKELRNHIRNLEHCRVEVILNRGDSYL